MKKILVSLILMSMAAAVFAEPYADYRKTSDQDFCAYIEKAPSLTNSSDVRQFYFEKEKVALRTTLAQLPTAISPADALTVLGIADHFGFDKGVIQEYVTFTLSLPLNKKDGTDPTKLVMFWAKDIYEYLADEYKPGKPIDLFALVPLYDVQNKVVYLLVEDFNANVK